MKRIWIKNNPTQDRLGAEAAPGPHKHRSLYLQRADLHRQPLCPLVYDPDKTSVGTFPASSPRCLLFWNLCHETVRATKQHVQFNFNHIIYD